MEEIGPGDLINFRIIADDPHGLGGAEIMEWVDSRPATARSAS